MSRNGIAKGKNSGRVTQARAVSRVSKRRVSFLNGTFKLGVPFPL